MEFTKEANASPDTSLLCKTSKMNCFGFKSEGIVLGVKRLNRDCCIIIRNFSLNQLLKSFAVNIMKHKAHLHLKFKYLCVTMCS